MTNKNLISYDHSNPEVLFNTLHNNSMEETDIPPATSPEKKENAPKEKEVDVDWAQSVRDSKWASAEPTPSIDSRRPRQEFNSSVSRWANAGNSSYSYQKDRKFSGYGSIDPSKVDQSYNTRSGDSRRNNGWDSRPYNRFSPQQNNHNRSTYENRSSPQQNDHNHSRYENRGYEPRKTSHPTNESRWASTESRWATTNVHNKSGSEFQTRASIQTNGASTLQSRPWNKRFLADQDGSTASTEDETRSSNIPYSTSLATSDSAAVQAEEAAKVEEEEPKDEASEVTGGVQSSLDLHHDNEEVGSVSADESNTLLHVAEEKSQDDGEPKNDQIEQPASVKRRPSIEIGHWGRPPTVDSGAADISDEPQWQSANDHEQQSSYRNRKSKDFQGSSASIHATNANEHSSESEPPTDNHSRIPHGSGGSPGAFAESATQHNNGWKDRSNVRRTSVDHSKSVKVEDRTTTGGFVKHNIDEEALNARIERIRLQNEKIQQRQKLIEEEEREIAKQLQAEKEERDRRRKEDELAEEAARIAAEEAKRDRMEREKRIAEEIRVEREANAARKANALASRDWDAEKEDGDLYIKEGRNRGDSNNRDRSTRYHGGFPGRQMDENRKKYAPEAKPFSVTEEAWPDLGSAAAGTPVKAAVWPARAAAEAKVQQKQEPSKEAPVNSPPTTKASASKLVSLSAARKAEMEKAEEVNQKSSISWEEMLAKQKPVTDWATDSPTNEDIDFEDSPFK